MESVSPEKDSFLRAADIDLQPVMIDAIDFSHYSKVSLSSVANWGACFSHIASAVQEIASNSARGLNSIAGKSGLYQVIVPPNAHLAEFRDGRGFLGSALFDKNSKIAGQAVLSPVSSIPQLSPASFNPTALFMTAALINIDKKLTRIGKTCDEILNYLVQKDRAALEGDLRFLRDGLENYKYNWDNKAYKNSYHTKVLDIKQAAEQKIQFCKQQISGAGHHMSSIKFEQDVKKSVKKTSYILDDYQLALYLYAFSSYMDVIFLDNFNAGFIDGVINKINSYHFEYQQLYAKYCSTATHNLKSSAEFLALGTLSAAMRSVGKVAGKTPVVNKSPIDKALVNAGHALSDYKMHQTKKTMGRLTAKQHPSIAPFIENLQTVSRLYNSPFEIVFDKENMYIQTTE